MAAYTQPYVIQCVELAAERAANGVRQQMRRRVTSLASIAGTAAFFGFFGTVVGIMNSFKSMGTSRSTALGAVAGGCSEAMVPTLLGLLVALPAFWFYRCLSGQLETFDLQMKNASVDLVNRLVVHLERLRSTDAAAWSALVRRPPATPVVTYVEEPFAGPCFEIRRIYRHGVLELFWPRLESEFDAGTILNAAAWVCLAYGIIGYFCYWIYRRSITGALIFAFFAVAGAVVRRGSRGAILTVLAFCFAAAAACIVPYGLSFAPVCLLLAPLPLVGSFRIVLRMGRVRSSGAAMILLGVLLCSAIIAVLLGTVLGSYRTRGDDESMAPTIRAGDWVAGVRAPLMGPVYRGELVEFDRGTARVVGLYGDRIEIQAGGLIRNGKAVMEPYCTAFDEPVGDFPLPSEAYPGDWHYVHESAYGYSLKKGHAYFVPQGYYFVLNDNRKELFDSRTVGPAPEESVEAKLLAAYSPWSLPRLLRSPGNR